MRIRMRSGNAEPNPASLHHASWSIMKAFAWIKARRKTLLALLVSLCFILLVFRFAGYILLVVNCKTEPANPVVWSLVRMLPYRVYWVHCNAQGRRIAAGTYRKGVKDGFWTYWHRNGEKAEEGQYANGQKVDVWARWDETGATLPDGPFMFVDGNGRRTEGAYKDGKKHGLWRQWFRNGKKRFEIEYSEGVLHGRYVYWDENGHLSYQWYYHNGREDGQSIAWWPNGKKAMEFHYSNGRKVGLWKWFDEEGKVIREEQHGSKEGTAPRH